MDLRKDFGVDRNLEIEGKWENIDEKSRILVARTGNPRYEEELQKAVRPYRNMIRRNQLSPEKNREIINRVMSRTILLGWDQLDEGGNLAPPYSHEEAERILNSYPAFRDLVADLADDMSRFIEEDTTEAGESSEPA